MNLKVKVSGRVMEGLRNLTRHTNINLLNKKDMISRASSNGFSETLDWLVKSKVQYVRGVAFGFYTEELTTIIETATQNVEPDTTKIEQEDENFNVNPIDDQIIPDPEFLQEEVLPPLLSSVKLPDFSTIPESFYEEIAATSVVAPPEFTDEADNELSQTHVFNYKKFREGG